MELSIHEFVFAVLACCGSAVLVVSLVSRWRHGRAEARAMNERVICRLCLHAFSDDQHTPRGRVIECPICGTANEKGAR